MPTLLNINLSIQNLNYGGLLQMNKDFDKQSSDKLQTKKRDKIRTIVLSLLITIFFKGLAVTANNQLSNESLKNIKVETVNSWNRMKNYNNKSFKD